MEYFSQEAASKLINDALNQKDILKRISETEKVLEKSHQIIADPYIKKRFDDLTEQYLMDCLETEQCEKSVRLLLDERRYSANNKKRFLEVAVATFLKCGKMKEALEWIESVDYCFGTEAIMHLKKNDNFKRLHKSKKFLSFFGPEAKVKRIKEDLKESMRMWKNDDYDNMKDAILMSRDILKEIPESEINLMALAQKHYDDIIKEAKKMMEEDSETKEYLDGLL